MVPGSLDLQIPEFQIPEFQIPEFQIHLKHNYYLQINLQVRT